jgi:hypothetical protein
MALVFSTVLQARDAGSFDRYGYRHYDSATSQCTYAYVDASGGSVLGLTAASAMAPASDDGAAVVGLAAPFELYGNSINALVVSSNGYLAAADNLSIEDGGDFSADCPLPAIADNPAASQSRIYVYHADLDGAPNSGTIQTQYFANCPRPGEAGAAEACTVVQWQSWALRGQGGSLNMQAVLYHETFEIALQYQALDASLGSTATIGLQGSDAISGNAAGCAGSRPLLQVSAICLFDPRFPPQPHVVDAIFADGFD